MGVPLLIHQVCHAFPKHNSVGKFIQLKWESPKSDHISIHTKIQDIPTIYIQANYPTKSITCLTMTHPRYGFSSKSNLGPHGIASWSVLMTDRLRNTRREYQNFAILHTSGSLMAVVPCLEYPQDNY